MMMCLALAKTTCRIPYTSYCLTYKFGKVAPRDGFEPPAKRLTVACSTAELPGNNQWQKPTQWQVYTNHLKYRQAMLSRIITIFYDRSKGLMRCGVVQALGYHPPLF